MDEEEGDAKTILLLLLLKNLMTEYGLQFYITSEMNKSENHEIARVIDIDNFVVGTQITSLIMTQISQRKDIWDVFSELVDNEGAEIYLRDADYYLDTTQPGNFFAAQAAAAQKNSILLGYQLYEDDRCVTNPVKDELIDYSKIRKFIVLANQ